MMEDEHSLMTITKEKYPKIPYFLFGHSMGLRITRDFIVTYGNEWIFHTNTSSSIMPMIHLMLLPNQIRINQCMILHK